MILQTQIMIVWAISFAVKEAAPKLFQDAKGREFLARTTVQIHLRVEGVETQVVAVAVVLVVARSISSLMAAAHRIRPSLCSVVKVTVTQTVTARQDCTASKETVASLCLGVMGPMTRERITVYHSTLELREVEVEVAPPAATLELRGGELVAALPPTAVVTTKAAVHDHWEQRLALMSPMSLSSVLDRLG